jgi:glycosyltransferase involved in cell wall biosynthesis
MGSVPYLSVVVPVFNEEENLLPLSDELISVLSSIGKPWEIIFVDDGSTDNSPAILDNIREKNSGVQIITIKKNFGQTAAFDAGFKESRGDIIITMDADMQNDPHDIPKLLENIGKYDLVCGWRQERNDSFIRQTSSIIANYVRNLLSREDIRDVGCSLKAFRREYAQKIKLYSGMHRFFPTLVKMEGGRVTEIKVNHRSRKHGKTKYNIRNRITRSFVDLLAVCWMKKRCLSYEIKDHKK